MATIRQIQANRRNAQNSTGPRTEQGKAASRLNALKTGVDARSHVIPGENPEALETLARDHYERFQPAAPEQRFLVDAMVFAEWQLRRLRKAEVQIWDYGMKNWRPEENLVSSGRAFLWGMDSLTRLHRRIDAAERSYYRALKQLLQWQSGHPAPAADQARRPVALPVLEFPPLPDVREPSPEQPPSPGIGFVPSARRAALGPPAPFSSIPKLHPPDYANSALQSTVSPH